MSFESGAFKVKNIGNREAFPTRRIIVQFADENSILYTINETSNDVDVKVNLSRNYGGIDPKATVSILNLSEEVIRNITTTNFAPKNAKKIIVYAGYETKGNETSNIPHLFSGTILWALPTTGRPDVWFSVRSVENFFRDSTNIIIDKIDNDIYGFELVKMVYESAGAIVDDSLFEFLKNDDSQKGRIKEYKIGNPLYTFNGTFGKFVREEVFKWGRMSVCQMSDKVILLPCSSDIDYITSKMKASDYPVISASSNPTMIGIPSPNPTGINFTTLFETDVLLPMKRFTLNSFIFPMFDNYLYWVQKVDYDLQLRGQNFYSHITARRAVANV